MGTFDPIGARSGWRRASAAVLCCHIALGVPSGAIGAPHVPSDDEQILERLPRRSGPEWDDIGALRAELASNPREPRLAAELARRYLELFRLDGDPRLVAYAAAALDPWAGVGDAPIEVALQRVRVAQTEHRFTAAKAELEQLLARAPRDSQAWLLAAAMALTEGEYAASKRACGRLLLLADAAVAGGCFAAVQALTGEARNAYENLRRGLEQRGADLDPDAALWLEGLAAEIAANLGRETDADRHFRAAFERAIEIDGRPSIYLLSVYADFLLDRNRPEAVLTLLADAPPADPIALRVAVAERRLGRMPTAAIETLRYRLQLALQGYEHTHAREAAYFALQVLDEPQRALDLALRNWQTQREPLDARLVLEAALRAADPHAAASVIEWLDANGIDHVGLRALAAQLEAPP